MLVVSCPAEVLASLFFPPWKLWQQASLVGCFKDSSLLSIYRTLAKQAGDETGSLRIKQQESLFSCVCMSVRVSRAHTN